MMLEVESVEPDTARDSVVEEVVSRDELLGRHIPGGSTGLIDSLLLRTRGIPRAISVPMLPAGTPPQTRATWHSAAAGRSASTLSRTASSYRPLGSTWRDWDVHLSSSSRSRTGFRAHSSSAATEDAKEFVHGCVPHWGKDATIKVRGALEYELTWIYYRIRRQREHPLRNTVTHPRVNGVQLDFWEVCKPPFSVSSAARVSESDAGTRDGVLHKVQYEVGVDYETERKGESSSEGGTFDNKMSGVAEVRLLPGFPKERPAVVVSWGEPTMFKRPEIVETTKGVDPETWNPLAQMLGIRPDDPRMRSSNEAAKRLSAVRTNGQINVPPMRKALLGPHPSLPQLARCEQAIMEQHLALLNIQEAAERTRKDASTAGAQAGSTKKLRKHKVFTPACGFLEYHG